MDLNEFSTTLHSIDEKLVSEIEVGQKITKINQKYIEQYADFLKATLKPNCDESIINYLAFNLYACTLSEFALASAHKNILSKAGDIFNRQLEMYHSLRDAHLKTVSKLDKTKLDRIKGATIAHQETEQMKNEIVIDYLSNKTTFNSKDEAAEHYKKIYPLKFGTIRNYLKNK